MNDPIQVLHIGPGAPDLSTSAWGPFVVHALPSLDGVAEALSQQNYDAAVLGAGSDASVPSLLAWPGLSRLALETAVLAVVPEPTAADADRLIQLGLQDVLAQRGLHADVLARALRLAVVRNRLDKAARKAYATDLSTGLPNHGQLMEHMTHLLALREREPAAMALLALRVEGLEATEARLGTEAANVLRRKVAVRLRAGLRASDVVASVGANTFAVLLAWVDSVADGERVAQKLAGSLQRPFSVTGQDVAVAVAVGVARYPDDGKEAGALMARALDQASSGVVRGRTGLSARAMGSAANDG